MKGRLDLSVPPMAARLGPLRGLCRRSLDDRNPALGQSRTGKAPSSRAYVIASNYDETGSALQGRAGGPGVRRRLRHALRTTAAPGRSPFDPTIRKFYEGTGLVSPYGKIVQLPDNTLLMAVYF